MAGSSTAGKVIPFPGAATAAPEELRAARPDGNASALSVRVSVRALAAAAAIHAAAVGGLLVWPMSPPVLAPAIMVEVVAMAPPTPQQEPARTIVKTPDPPPIPEPETASVPVPVEPASEAVPEPPPSVTPLLTLNQAPTQQAVALPRAAPAMSAAPVPSTAPTRDRAATTAYTAVLLSWLERYRQYPRLARLKRTEGTVILALTLSRSGSLKAVALKKGSGHAILDNAALDMIRRADPFPPLPATFTHDRLEFVVPIVFALE